MTSLLLLGSATLDPVSARSSTVDEWDVGKMLREKLDVWDSYPTDKIVHVLTDLIDDPRPEYRPYLVRFLHVDPSWEGCTFVSDTAILALGRLGGAGVLEEMQTLVDADRRDLFPSVAVALGSLDDEKAVPILERLAGLPEPRIRDFALGSLSQYCSPSSARYAIREANADSDDVRVSAIFWLSRCGEGEETARLLAAGLEDRSELVRHHAVRGLIRVKDTRACDRLDALIGDENLMVQKAAREYAEVCKGTDAEHR